MTLGLSILLGVYSYMYLMTLGTNTIFDTPEREIALALLLTLLLPFGLITAPFCLALRLIRGY